MHCPRRLRCPRHALVVESKQGANEGHRKASLGSPRKVHSGCISRDAFSRVCICTVPSC